MAFQLQSFSSLFRFDDLQAEDISALNSNDLDAFWQSKFESAKNLRIYRKEDDFEKSNTVYELFTQAAFTDAVPTLTPQNQLYIHNNDVRIDCSTKSSSQATCDAFKTVLRINHGIMVFDERNNAANRFLQAFNHLKV